MTGGDHCRTVWCMPNYLVQYESVSQAVRESDARSHLDSELGVTWGITFLGLNCVVTFSHCEAPSPEALRASARAHGFAVERITQVTALRR